MAGVVLYGPSGNVLIPAAPAVVEPTFGALRVTQRPTEYSYAGFTGGHYRAIGLTAAAAFAANAILGAFRFAPTNNSPLAIVTRITAHLYVVTAVTAQRMDPLVATVQRSYTAADSTNATAISVAANGGKMKSSMGSAMASFGVASAAAGASGGTKTPDAAPFAFSPTSSSVAMAGLGTGTVPWDMFNAIDNGQHPLTLSPNEGFTVALGATAIATGTVVAAISVEWIEALTF